MTPYEIMLSESQERMLLVVKKGREREVERIFDKWDLHAVRIGEVTDDGRLHVKERGQTVAQIPTAALTDGAPVYERPMTEPAYIAEAAQLALRSRQASGDPGGFHTTAGVTDDRQQTLGLSSVRPHGAHQYARDTGYGRRCRSCEGTGRALALSVTGMAAMFISTPSWVRSWRWPRLLGMSHVQARNRWARRIA